MTEKFIIAALVFSVVNIVATFINLIGAISGLPCPRALPWLGSWFAVAIGLAIFAAFKFA